MAENKNSFILYTDLIHTVKKMPKEKAGELFMTILSYVNDENPVVEDLVVDLVFEPVKQQLKRDLKKFESKKEKRSEAGKLGGIKSGEKRKNEANEANASNASKNEANEADTVNDNVTVNVTDNDIILNNCVKIPIKDSIFPSMPRAEDLGAAPKPTLQSAKEMVKITCQVDLEEDEVKTMWNIFKSQNLTGKRYYPDKEAIYAYFINWVQTKNFKKQKNGNLTKKHAQQVGQEMDFDNP
jgi:hypothetical protein